MRPIRTALSFGFFFISILAGVAAWTAEERAAAKSYAPNEPAATAAEAITVPITRIRRSGSNIVLRFQAAAGSTYRLERKLSLADSNWQTIDGVSDFSASESGPEEIADPGALGLGKGFYRVMLPTQFNCGALCFIERYAADGSVPPSPEFGRRGLSTQLQKVDVGFVVDTTGSMSGEITNLKNSLSTTIIPALQATIPNLGIGVAAHDDVPYSTYGQPAPPAPPPGDKAFYLPGPVTTVTANAQAAVNSLTTHNGLDLAESQVLALYKAVTGAAITWPTGSLPAETPPAGTFGALQFRSGAFPIVISITDVSHHNGKRALDKTGTSYDATYQNTYSFATWNVDDVVTALNGVGAKFITVESGPNARALGIDDPYGYAAYITDKTNSNVPPSAFDPGPGCAAGQCCTGINGAGVTPDGPGGSCRSIWSVTTTGAGLGTSIVNGVVAVINSTQFNIYVQAYTDPAEMVDVVGNFILQVEPDPNGGTDPGTGEVCASFPAGQLADNFTGPTALTAGPDGVPDTITQVNANSVFCFKVTARPNTVIPPTTTEKTFRAWLRILAFSSNGTITLGPDREVLFVIPPIGY